MQLYFGTSGCVSSFPSELYYATVKIATGRKFYDLCGKGCGATEMNKEWVSYKIIHLPPSGLRSPFLLSSANFEALSQHRVLLQDSGWH